MKIKTSQYMAGLFDAEGCFTINSSFRDKSNCMGFTAQIIFTNTNLSLIKWIIKHFGGVYKLRKKSAGKQAYDWKITNQKHAMSFISQIEPYIIVKKEQLSLMKEYYSLSGSANPLKRKELQETIKRLKWDKGSVTTDTPTFEGSNAYCAGFVDGDGHISMNLKASNTDKRVITTFKSLYGGNICINKLSLKNPNWNDEYIWNINNKEKIESILLKWLPYLIDKKFNAKLLLNSIRDSKKIQSKLMGDHESELMGTLIS